MLGDCLTCTESPEVVPTDYDYPLAFVFEEFRLPQSNKIYLFQWSSVFSTNKNSDINYVNRLMSPLCVVPTLNPTG